MKNAYLCVGDRFISTDMEPDARHDELPPQVYSIGMTREGWFFKPIESFTLPSRMYGEINSQAKRIINTFHSRPSGTGVLLSGEKGSGKTMLAKKISLDLMKEGIATFLVNEPMYGEEFNRMIQDIRQPALVLFDEFEKVYAREHQEKLLTLLDGTFSGHKLFIFTSNDRYKLDTCMRNRPGRIYYNLEFRALTEDFIREYCEDQLNNKSRIADVVRVSGVFAQFNFDMLKALVEEMNRYDEPAAISMQFLNIRTEFEDGQTYSAYICYRGQRINPASTDTFSGSPMFYLARNTSGWYLTQAATPELRKKLEIPNELFDCPDIPDDNDVLAHIRADTFKSMSANGEFIYNTTTHPDLTIVLVRNKPIYIDMHY